MAYDAPTAAQFKTRFPVFAAVADDTVTAALSEAGGRVDNTWTAADYAPAIMLLAAHNLSLDGLGTATETQLQGFRRVKIGTLELEREPGATVNTPTLQITSYGRRFLDLARLNLAGPLVTT